MPEAYLVGNDDTQHFSIFYSIRGNPAGRAALEAQWKSFNRLDPSTRQALKIICRPTNSKSGVTVERRLPAEAQPGRYRVETFIPARHANARKAYFTIAHNFMNLGDRKQHDSALVLLDQSDWNDVWVSLGEFDLDLSTDPLSGAVYQHDWSTEDPAAVASFGPVRWLPLQVEGAADIRFDSPVGSKEQREGPFPASGPGSSRYPKWTGAWLDVNPYLSWYSLGFHTGADLNLPGGSAADRGQPIYSVGDGVVVYAGKAGSWGYIVVVEHPDATVTLPSGRVQRQPVFSRYGHVEAEIPVHTGQAVERGQLVGRVGLPANQVTGWHLHFDVCYSGLLKKRPTHWPDLSTLRALQQAGAKPESRAYQSAQAAIRREVLAHYIDPLRFIRDNHL